MREAQLRKVLLVRAVEEAEGTARLIPEAERRSATREAARNTGDPPNGDAAREGGALTRRAQAMLAARAELLIEPVLRDHRFVDSVLRLAGGSATAGWLLVLTSVVLGGALSVLDGTRRIDILSRPLLALVLWNLLVYALVIATAAGATAGRRANRPVRRALAAESVLRRVRRMVARSARYDTALARALESFVRQWTEVAKPLLVARATRLFHLCAAAAGLGFIGALYLRGLTVDYSAGWESTLLDAERVRTFVSVFYGPASALSGIALPDAPHLEAIRWADGAGGERADYWIHLLAASVAIYVVAPRLVLAFAGTLAVWRHALNIPLPQGLAAYFARTFGEGQAGGLRVVTVAPYGYEPAGDAPARLSQRLRSALGEGVAIDCIAAVRYGDEDGLLRDARQARDGVALALLVNLAATPEEENHGAAIGRLQARLAHNTSGGGLVLVDEGPYAARMQALGGAAERMNERRRTWKAFVERHGAQPCFINLADDPPAPEETERLKAAVLRR
jgi:hypothetical protein